MSGQPLRGSNSTNLETVASTLELALSSANDEAELRRFIQVVINSCREHKAPKKKTTNLKTFNTSTMNDDVECPYCGKYQEINHDDGQGYEEGVKHHQRCGECGKTFVFETSVSYYYEAEKAGCLNGENHNYKPTRTFPREYTMMRCGMCDDERKPTEKEMKEILTQ